VQQSFDKRLLARTGVHKVHFGKMKKSVCVCVCVCFCVCVCGVCVCVSQKLYDEEKHAVTLSKKQGLKIQKS